MTTIGNKLQLVRERISQACDKSHRKPSEVHLLAVSKTFSADVVREAAAQGQRAFGENYIQETVAKIEALSGLGLEWHCIGPVQSNKTRLVAEHFDWMHTVDRAKIAERLSAQRPAHLPPLQVCIQINVDGGLAKSGVPPEEALALARAVAALPQLCLRGVMSIPEPAPDHATQLALHQRVRAVFEQIRASGGSGLDHFDTLSLGMTADLDAAIQAGSTMVRVGTGIFGGRARPAV